EVGEAQGRTGAAVAQVQRLLGGQRDVVAVEGRVVDGVRLAADDEGAAPGEGVDDRVGEVVAEQLVDGAGGDGLGAGALEGGAAEVDGAIDVDELVAGSGGVAAVEIDADGRAGRQAEALAGVAGAGGDAAAAGDADPGAGGVECAGAVQGDVAEAAG